MVTNSIYENKKYKVNTNKKLILVEKGITITRCLFPSSCRNLYLECLRWLLLFCLLKSGHGFNIAPKATYIASLETSLENPSYFGYSVGLLQTKTSEFWLLAGAPLANSTGSKNVISPGAFYKCPIDKPDQGCEEVILDTTENFEKVKDDIYPFRDNAWTGASLDVDNDGNVIVCAPRWKNARYVEEYRISGACYLPGQDLRNNSALFIDPLINSDNQIYNYFGRGVFYYAHGQCGMDVRFTNNSELIIGSPGVLNWQGSVARFVRQPNVPVGGINRRETSFIYTKRVIPNPIRTSKIQDSDFFGYSVTSGKFDNGNGLYFVAGAPRSASLYGMVLVFLMKDREYQPLHIKETKQGAQIGEYFGASVAAPDLNGDGLSDLVVGAPFYSVDGLYDVGCVYVFINNVRENVEGLTQLSLEAVRILGDVSQLARFGTSLGTPGDLDNDGYQDVLVGAPYENDNSGAVYVFMGSANGIREKYEQKLLPEEVSPSISFRGFGISFSRPLDVDKNLYPDFAVGSFLSDSAVLMFTRPVVIIRGELSANPPKLSFAQKNFTLSACLKYEGTEMHDNIEILAHVFVNQESETGEVIAAFNDYGSQEKYIHFSVPHKEKTCYDFRVDLKLEKSNAQKLIDVRMNFELKNKHLNGPADPVMSPHNSFPPRLNLSFITGCENDNFCLSDLHSTARLKNFSVGSLLPIGAFPKVTLEVDTWNKREPAFLPNVTISVPKPIVILPSLRDCSTGQDVDNTVVVCQLKNPLLSYEKDSILLDLDLSQLDDSTPDIKINVHSDSSDLEKNPDDNHFSLEVKVQKNASIEVTGWPSPEQVTYERINDLEIAENKTAAIEHNFAITKSGVTPLREVDVAVYVPYNVTLPNGEEVRVIEDFGHRLSHSQSSSCDLEYSTKQKQTFNRMFENLNETYFTSSRSFSCESSYVKCSVIRCKIGPWKRKNEVAQLSVSFTVNISALSYVISAKDGFSLLSFVEVNIATYKEVPQVDGKRQDTGMVETIFYPGSLPVQPLASWIYLMAILGGLFVLLVIAFILYKVGFFKRKAKEELKAQQATLLSKDDEQ